MTTSEPSSRRPSAIGTAPGPNPARREIDMPGGAYPLSCLDCAQSRHIHWIRISCSRSAEFHLMQNSHHFARADKWYLEVAPNGSYRHSRDSATSGSARSGPAALLRLSPAGLAIAGTAEPSAISRFADSRHQGTPAWVCRASLHGRHRADPRSAFPVLPGRACLPVRGPDGLTPIDSSARSAVNDCKFSGDVRLTTPRIIGLSSSWRTCGWGELHSPIVTVTVALITSRA